MFFKKSECKIVFVDSSNLGLEIKKAIESLNKDFKDKWKLNIIKIDYLTSKEKEKYFEIMKDADLVLIDIRGNHPVVKEIGTQLEKSKNTVISLMGGSTELMSLTRMGIFNARKFFNSKRMKSGSPSAQMKFDGDLDKIQNMLKEKLPSFVYKDVGAWFDTVKYWSLNGQRNIKQMILMLSKNYVKLKGIKEYEPPFKYPLPSIYNPLEDVYYNSSNEYKNKYFDENLPTIALLYYGGVHYENNKSTVQMIITKLNNKANVLPILTDGIKNLEAIKEMGVTDGEVQFDLMINLTWFRLNGGPLGGDSIVTKEFIEKLGVPVIHPIAMYSSKISEWEDTEKGVNSMVYLSNVVLPEIDGSIEPIPICGSIEVDKDSDIVIPIEERVDKLLDRAIKLVNLGKKKNKEKKIGLIIYNYPPGQGNIGNAAFFDTFKSVTKIIERLKDEGYNTSITQEDLSEVFVKKGLSNSPQWENENECIKVSIEEYSSWMEKDLEIFNKINKTWGKVEDGIMVENNEILLPIKKYGNVLVAVQPTRGGHEDVVKSYHDKNSPPHHQYVAFYKYLTDVEKVDAIVHIGTHGTLEFLDGKEIGISKNCIADNLIGNTPHFYIYEVSNPSEAMIAKRRGLATLVSYNTPVMKKSGLYGEYERLEELINEYEDTKLISEEKAIEIFNEIFDITKKLDWDKWDKLEAIEAKLYEYKRSIIPMGLHIFGQKYTKEEKLGFIKEILKFDRGNLKSINRLVAETKNINYDKLLEVDSKVLSEIDLESNILIEEYFNGENKYLENLKIDKSDFNELMNLGNKIYEELEEDVEFNGLLNGLNGKFVRAGLSANVLRNPEVIKTGTNLYQFDPLSMPSDIAYKRGAQIAQKIIDDYYRENNEHLKKAAVVLWGFETAKTKGETVGQIFTYLGVRLKSKKGDWFQDIELIPAIELNRPRVDVVINICGFFRDMFPNLIELIDKAINLVIDDATEDNVVRENYLNAKEKLSATDKSKEEIEIFSRARIYGPKNSEYGTSLTTMVETSRWENEEEFGDVFASEMSYVYGKGVHGVKSSLSLSLNLSNVEVISQVQDTYEYEITDLDHYYEFFGGMTKAIEKNKGEKPKMVIANTSRDVLKVQNVNEAIERGVATRTLNPEYIDALLEHKYHGAQKLADKLSYQLGLSATTGAIKDSMWKDVANKFLFDEKMRERLVDNNIHATMKMTEIIMEAQKRGYYNATEQEVVMLQEVYLDLEDYLEGEYE